MMNAGTIVGHITRPNGSPISDAEIWIGETVNAQEKTSARTDSRGYFQLPLVNCEADINTVFSTGGKLTVSVGTQKGIRKNSADGFQVTGYLISEILNSEA